MNVVFVTFADSKFSSSRRRIAREARSFNIFDRIYSLDERFFDKEFRSFFRQGDKKSQRGYGYWCWKPYCIRRVLQELQEGDILLYADAGCHLNIGGRQRLVEYIELCRENSLVAFDQNTVEEQYTKEDVFNYLGISDADTGIRQGTQFGGGAILMRKCRSIEDLVGQWYDISRNHYDLINDSPSVLENSKSFVEHRHDQSVFSVLAKLHGCVAIQCQETYPQNGDWTSMGQFPIWAMRDKTIDLFQLLKLKVLKIIR